ncbi:hypothetical protein ACFL2F_04395 [Myxococcota bacterium]
MILVLAENKHDLRGVAEGEVSFRNAECVEAVLGWVESEPIERIVVPYPTDPNINPFSLARRLRKIHGPPVVLAGELRLDTQFWAERNGCEVARSVEDAIGQ